MVLYAAEAPIVSGAWGVEPDATAAGASKLRNANAGAPKLTTALANPVNFFEMTFNAEAGRPYRLVGARESGREQLGERLALRAVRPWRVDVNGTAVWRIGTTAAAE